MFFSYYLLQALLCVQACFAVESSHGLSTLGCGEFRPLPRNLTWQRALDLCPFLPVEGFLRDLFKKAAWLTRLRKIDKLTSPIDLVHLAEPHMNCYVIIHT